MKYPLASSLTALLASTSLALAQAPVLSPYHTIPQPETSKVTQTAAKAPTTPATTPTSPYRLTLDVASDDEDQASSDKLAATEKTPPAVPAAGTPKAGEQRLAPEAFNGQYDAAGSRLWGKSEYILWWTKSPSSPPLVATAPSSLANSATFPAGSIHPLLGGGNLDYQGYSGGRFTLGYQPDSEGTAGIEGNYFFTEQRSFRFAGQSNGNPLLGPTFVDIRNNQLTLLKIADPGRFVGSESVGVPSQFWGTEVNLRFKTNPVFADHLYFLAGFRYFELSEGLTRIDKSMGVGQLAGVELDGLDNIGTRNQFYGGQVGFSGESKIGDTWTLNVIGKFAMGGVAQRTNINGSSFLVVPGQPIVLGNGNVLALPTNIGHHTNNRFAILPELTMNLGYQVTSRLNAFMGYNLLYLDRVARPTRNIDFGVNATQIPFAGNNGATPTLMGAARPGVLEHSDSFWAQGINFGFQFAY